MEFSCREVASQSRSKLASIVTMAWIESLIVAGLGFALVEGPGRFWFSVVLLVPVAVTNALLYQLSGSKVLLEGTTLTVRWLRSKRFHYSFNVEQMSTCDVTPNEGPPWTRDSFHASSGLLELVRGRSPLVGIEFRVPQQVTYAGGGLRLWGNPKPTRVSVRRVLLAVDDPAGLVEALARLRRRGDSDAC